ncbi:hypothetical protein [Clostridioides difficile]|nr:hypothetical protein [Clostridioides difficile]
MYDGLDLDNFEIVNKYYAIAQEIVLEELDMGNISDMQGFNIVFEYYII